MLNELKLTTFIGLEGENYDEIDGRCNDEIRNSFLKNQFKEEIFESIKNRVGNLLEKGEIVYLEQILDIIDFSLGNSIDVIETEKSCIVNITEKGKNKLNDLIFYLELKNLIEIELEKEYITSIRLKKLENKLLERDFKPDDKFNISLKNERLKNEKNEKIFDEKKEDLESLFIKEDFYTIILKLNKVDKGFDHYLEELGLSGEGLELFLGLFNEVRNRVKKINIELEVNKVLEKNKEEKKNLEDDYFEDAGDINFLEKIGNTLYRHRGKTALVLLLSSILHHYLNSDNPKNSNITDIEDFSTTRGNSFYMDSNKFRILEDKTKEVISNNKEKYFVQSGEWKNLQSIVNKEVIPTFKNSESFIEFRENFSNLFFNKSIEHGLVGINVFMDFDFKGEVIIKYTMLDGSTEINIYNVTKALTQDFINDYTIHSFKDFIERDVASNNIKSNSNTLITNLKKSLKKETITFFNKVSNLGISSLNYSIQNIGIDFIVVRFNLSNGTIFNIKFSVKNMLKKDNSYFQQQEILEEVSLKLLNESKNITNQNDRLNFIGENIVEYFNKSSNNKSTATRISMWENEGILHIYLSLAGRYITYKLDLNNPN